MTIQKHKLKRDSITTVDIYFYPSFTNSSILRLNRLTGEGAFAVDNRLVVSFGKPDTLNFHITDMESETDIELFWRSKFVHSLKQGTSMLGWTDGIGVWVLYGNNEVKDSVYLGNVYPKSVDSLLLRQIDWLSKKTKTRAMKKYLGQIKRDL